MPDMECPYCGEILDRLHPRGALVCWTDGCRNAERALTMAQVEEQAEAVGVAAAERHEGRLWADVDLSHVVHGPGSD